MNNKLLSLIQPTELLEIYQNDEVVIVDASNGENAKLNYVEKHIDNAIFVDLNSQLADVNDNLANGGRHPLPKIDRFAKTLKEIGISKNSHVVIYDDKCGANAAARFWWMLKSIGHEKVQVLNGGIQEAEKIGLKMSNKVQKNKIVEDYEFTNWELPIVEIDEVEENSMKQNSLIIDVRENIRYRGVMEPIDLIAGHISNSINIPFSTNLDSTGMFLPLNELKLKYLNLFSNREIKDVIVHCGSGVTACHTILALDYVGFEIPKLYVGSWSEWSRNNKKVISEK